MTTAEAAESGTAEVTTAAAEAAVSSQETRDWESEARDIGWIPEAEFKGTRKPEKFKTAQEFVEGVPPYVRKLLDKAEAKSNERLSKIEAVNAKTVAAIERQHAQEMTDLRAERREAIKAADPDKVEAIDKKIDALKEDAPAPKLTGAALEAHRIKVQTDWEAKNLWFHENDDMFDFAFAFSNRLATKTPDISIEDNLKQVDEAVRKKFPEKFGGKPASANGHALVDGGGSFPGAGGSKTEAWAKGLSAVEKAKALDDMKKFPEQYPDGDTWRTTYDS